MTESPHPVSWLKRASIAFLCSILVVGGGLAHVVWYLHSPILSGDEDTLVVIPEGSAFSRVSEELVQAGLVERPLYLKLYAVQAGLDDKLRAGAYAVPPGTTPAELLDLLTVGGKDAQVRITVREGETLFHVADTLEATGLANRASFLVMARNASLLEKHSIRGDSVEGYLFPDTYFFRQSTAPEVILERMIARHKQVWAEVERDVGASAIDALSGTYGLDVHEFITLASMIEREAIVGDERPIISRVFYNRFDEKMRLQSDPTCIYSEAHYRAKPTRALCRDPKSRYSTYVIKGLPPGPIANPGRASMRAALKPTTAPKDRDFLYFVARGDGSRRHTFSKTYAAHRKAIPR